MNWKPPVDWFKYKAGKPDQTQVFFDAHESGGNHPTSACAAARFFVKGRFPNLLKNALPI